MVTNKVDPTNAAPSRPGRGQMTWIGIIAVVLFILALAFAIFRPVVDRNDGAESEPNVVGPAADMAAP